MLRKFSNSRTLRQNLQLGGITAFAAGMTNVASLIAFFAFTSNVTGHYAILAEEIAKGHWHQVGVVIIWIFLFFIGNFLSNFLVINSEKLSKYVAHAIPIILEFICLVVVGVYGHFFYRETLTETEFLVAFLLFAMGIQNGLVASISNGTVKTTHLTGLTTDLGISLSMFTKKKFRRRRELRGKIKLLTFIASFYLLGGVISGVIFLRVEFLTFFFIAAVIAVVLLYDLGTLARMKYQLSKREKLKLIQEAKLS
ncbi:MAG: DUF1275 domain-containing protein [Cryomorphaceae bacterium]|nr:DUF1275 domain-containing protein [Cryomorphaceae bacterium]